jgi:hypothetical protein
MEDLNGSAHSKTATRGLHHSLWSADVRNKELHPLSVRIFLNNMVYSSQTRHINTVIMFDKNKNGSNARLFASFIPHTGVLESKIT